MDIRDPYILEALWYWEGPVRRYYKTLRGWRSSRELTLWHLTRGEVELLWRDGSQRVTAGKWIVPTPMCRNERFSADAEVRSLRLLALHRDGALLLNPDAPLVFPGSEDSGVHQAFDGLGELVRNRMGEEPGRKTLFREMDLEPEHFFELRALTSSCFTSLVRELRKMGMSVPGSSTAHPAVSASLHYLGERDLRHPLKEIDIAHAAGVSLPHLRRLFREQTGCTLKVWDAQRIENGVRRQLRAGDRSIKEISIDFGFYSPSHFSRWFRERFGRSPTEFQRLPYVDDQV
ncbi:MAG: AraC family transcriptional regulator [Kiritimatiellae bacterium]|jgi:AraC-like DNA-binding protein|nr:AraC family transcriptional regulator [Kiritimatiellia bacterium]